MKPDFKYNKFLIYFSLITATLEEADQKLKSYALSFFHGKPFEELIVIKRVLWINDFSV